MANKLSYWRKKYAFGELCDERKFLARPRTGVRVYLGLGLGLSYFHWLQLQPGTTCSWTTRRCYGM